ncbi:hypothetical protein [Gemmatimonas sp.]|uniref:hypothetical protein n=1 Tax=Gemmatimonas sp. TaxID=1962908 RepID=UPI003F70CA3B
MTRESRREGAPDAYAFGHRAPTARASYRAVFPSALLLGMVMAFLAAARPAGAQEPVRLPIPPSLPRDGQCVCSGSLEFVSLRVRRKDGTPITDATLRVRREDSNEMWRRDDAPISPGTYVVMQDGDLALRDVPPAGIPLRVDVRWKGKTQTAHVVVIGRDPCGCHITRLSGATEVVFP